MLIRDLRCPVCRSSYDEVDQVVLNEANTIIHASCYEPMNEFSEIMDKGTCYYILAKYEFFNELLEGH